MSLLNVLDYRDGNGVVQVQAALDDARDGDRVYLPGVQLRQQPYESPVGGPWIIRRSVEVFGDGPSNPGLDSGTTIVPGGGHDVFVIESPDPAPSRIDSVYLHDFQIRAAAGAAGLSGIHCRTAGEKGLGIVRLERIQVYNLYRHGFFLEGTNGVSGAIERLLMQDCGAVQCGELGLMGRHVLQAAIVRSNGNACGVGGAKFERCGAALYRSTFENNDPDGEAGTNPQLWFDACHVAVVDAGHIENFGTGVPKACIMRGSGGAAWLAATAFVSGSLNYEDSVGLEIPPASDGGPVLVAHGISSSCLSTTSRRPER